MSVCLLGGILDLKRFIGALSESYSSGGIRPIARIPSLAQVTTDSTKLQGVIMGVVDGAIRSVGRTVNNAAAVTTSAAAAVGGAAANGVIGGVTGAAEGVQRGLKSRSYSTPAAALTLGALGVIGLVEWPLLAAVGGGALLLRRLNQPSNGAAAPIDAEGENVVENVASPAKSAPRRTTAPKPKPPARTPTTRSRGGE